MHDHGRIVLCALLKFIAQVGQFVLGNKVNVPRKKAVETMLFNLVLR